MNYSSNSQNIGLGEEEEDIGPLPFEDDIENDNIDGNEEEDFNL